MVLRYLVMPLIYPFQIDAGLRDYWGMLKTPPPVLSEDFRLAIAEYWRTKDEVKTGPLYGQALNRPLWMEPGDERPLKTFLAADLLLAHF